jgi:hypothetical protein
MWFERFSRRSCFVVPEGSFLFSSSDIFPSEIATFDSHKKNDILYKAESASRNQ